MTLSVHPTWTLLPPSRPDCGATLLGEVQWILLELSRLAASGPVAALLAKPPEEPIRRHKGNHKDQGSHVGVVFGPYK